jgi:NADPH2:quinone reductase
MKSVICPAYGPPSVLELIDLPDPIPGPGEVVVRIKAAGINYPDLICVSGTYPIPSAPPFIPGIEGAGVVFSIGIGVTRFDVGDRVCWQNNVVKSAFSEAISLPETCLCKVPDGVDLTVASCIPTAFGTAAFALKHRAQLKSGETVVIHGATGGVGQAAIQIAIAHGARVIATGGSADKLSQLRALGAYETVLADDNMQTRILELTGGRRADVVLDTVGGDLFDASISLLAPYGRLLVVGFTSGEFGTARSNILLIKAISVIGVNYGHFLVTEPSAASREIEFILYQVAVGRLRPSVEVLEGLESVPESLRRLEARSVIGKLAIRV